MLAANGFQPGNLFSGNWGDLAGIPAGFADGTDADSLGTLSCSDGAIAQWDGTNWVCSDAAWAIPTAMEAPCTVETEGHIYLDSTANGVRVCDGTTYQLINFCTAECPDTSTFACGLDVIDTCGRACGTIGTALNITLCGEASSTTCGSDVVDDCDNSCGDVGTLCSQGVCQNDSCCGDGVLSGSESCDDGNNTADDGCSPTCTSEGYEHFTLTGTPNPAQVLNTIDRTFYYANNLVNGIWHRETNRIIVGHYSSDGYWSHPADSGGHPASPNNGTGAFDRMVHMPATGRVIHTDQDQYPSDYDRIYIGNIIQSTGLLENFAPVVFDDDFSGKCNLISSSAEHFLCYTENTVRWYKTDIDSTTLVHTQTITLAPAPAAVCDSHCFGGTFAWDGVNYYFAESGNSIASTSYQVFNASGNLIGTYFSTAGSAVTSVYFDWSVGRYAVHDGFGDRNGGSLYGWESGSTGDDSQTYSPVSSAHSL
ncbi:MAG: hypothetical protein CMH54_03320 [Myxococcales bacterium]|nr:hypothetical protein [Myxococcales bacterium]